MKKKVLYIERHPSEGISIERVFRQVTKCLSEKKFITEFDQVPFRTNFSGIIKNILYYKAKKADIYHITGHIHFITLLLPKKKTILTIHDTGILNIRTGLRRYILKKILFEIPIRRTKYITAISEQTKKDLIKYTNCSKDKIRVIENPLNEEFNVSEDKKFNSAYPQILQIGTSYNKNLNNLIKSLRGLDCFLKIIGRLNSEQKELLNYHNIKFDNVENISDQELVECYKKSDIVTFCSTFEGFGLPIIEAQSMRTPVITSNQSPMKEVAGDGAYFVDPHSVDSIKKGFMELIKNEQLRKTLITNGLKNVKRFNAERIAAKYEKIYEEIISSSLSKLT